MSKHIDALGTRMKQYENCYRIYLPKRSAICVRLDMRAGHSFTKGFERPYDEIFAQTMQQTALKLAENVSGCKFAFQQSDEISLVLTDYDSINTEPWFGNNLQKIVSITASMATMYFNGFFRTNAYKEDAIFAAKNYHECSDPIIESHLRAVGRMATFDSRAFILPREEVFNYFGWRQTDTVRNSIQLVGQAYFSHKRLQNKNCDEIQEMLWQEHSINWSKYPNWFKNGVSIYRRPTIVKHETPQGIVEVERNKWVIDTETPIFTQDHEYINKHIGVKD